MHLINQYSFEILHDINIFNEKNEINQQLSQSCLKLITVIVRECSDFIINEEQLIMLINLISNDLNHLERYNITFSLLKVK